MCPSKWIFINQMRNVFVLKSEMLQVCKYILSLSLSFSCINIAFLCSRNKFLAMTLVSIFTALLYTERQASSALWFLYFFRDLLDYLWQLSSLKPKRGFTAEADDYK